MTTVADIIAKLTALGDPTVIAGRGRYGIRAEITFGVSVPKIRELAKIVGRNQLLAEGLWSTGIHEARILASLVADPEQISESTVDLWVRDFDSWDVCDACTSNLFDRTPFAWKKLATWAADNKEFVRRTAFSLIAALAVHDKKAPDEKFLALLPLIEQYSFDERNFVKKAVNWALRSIGKRNPALCQAAIGAAERIRLQETSAARWIAADALRELRSRE